MSLLRRFGSESFFFQALLAHEFLRVALAAGLLAAVGCGIVGQYADRRAVSREHGRGHGRGHHGHRAHAGPQHRPVCAHGSAHAPAPPAVDHATSASQHAASGTNHAKLMTAILALADLL